MPRTVIHRDRTFTFGGRRYSLLDNGPGWGWEILDEDGRMVADGFFTLREVREHADRAAGEGWGELAAG